MYAGGRWSGCERYNIDSHNGFSADVKYSFPEVQKRREVTLA